MAAIQLVINNRPHEVEFAPDTPLLRVIFGLSAALKNEITIKNGAVEQTNFDGYDPVRMNEAPPIEVYLTQSADDPGGMGEPALPPIAPAVANAIFAASGQRLRKLPFQLKA